jgi:hypothetical protein
VLQIKVETDFLGVFEKNKSGRKERRRRRKKHSGIF